MIIDFLLYTFTNTDYSLRDKKKFSFFAYFKLALLEFVFMGVFMFVVSKFMLIPYNLNSGIHSMPISKVILLVAILFPFIEELMFRLWLERGRYNHLISGVICLSYIVYLLFTGGLYRNPFGIYSSLIVCFVILLSRYTRALNSIKLSLFVSSVLFSFAHIANFSGFESIDAYKLPFLVFPQLLGGLTMGYLRINYGFRYAVFAHCFTNLVVVLIGH